jgi:hypothetical protein
MKHKARGQSKRKKKRYIYARTQDLFKKNPSTLARYIREGVPWLEDQDTAVPQEAIQQFYTNLWGTNPDITLPFNPTPPMEEYMDILDQGPINI